MLRTALLSATLAALLLVGCSTTTLTGSWRDPEFKGAIRKVYIVGVSKQETVRRIFEDEFGKALQGYGVTGISSYRDLTGPKEASKEAIDERVRQNGADSVLMTRMVGKRTEEVVTPGRITGYDTGPRYGYGRYYAPDLYYRDWGNYYDRRFEATYEPATVTQFEVATIEANLYDAKSGALIWSAQLDTVMEANSQQLIADFVKIVTKDLLEQGLL